MNTPPGLMSMKLPPTFSDSCAPASRIRVAPDLRWISIPASRAWLWPTFSCWLVPTVSDCVPSTCSFPFTHPLYHGPFPRLGAPIRQLLMQHDLLF